MKMCKWFSFLVLIAMLTAMPSCGSSLAPVEPLTFDDVLEIANARRQTVHEKDMGMVYAMVEGRTPSAIEWERVIHSSRAGLISREEAMEDVVVLFDLLKHWYGAYKYFGGNAVFMPLRDSLIESLADRNDIVTLDFSLMVQDTLSQVIADNHFSFDGVAVGVSYNFFAWETPFVRSINGLRERDTDRYLLEVIGHELDEIFRLAVDDNGEFFYVAVVARHEDYGLMYSLSAVYEDGGVESVRLRNSSILSAPGRAHVPALVFKYDIPVVSMRGDFHLPFPCPYDSVPVLMPDNAALMLSFAEELRGQTNIIVDIRTNEGGNMGLPRMWLYRLMGEAVPSGRVFFQAVYPMPYDGASSHLLDMFHTQGQEGVWKFIGDYHVVEALTDRFVLNDVRIILLVDRFTVSAAEFFVGMVLNIENTLVIGQNTAGALLTNGGASMRLPNSGIPFRFGNGILVYREGDFREGIGYAPDVWVVGDALTAALAMLSGNLLEID